MFGYEHDKDKIRKCFIFKGDVKVNRDIRVIIPSRYKETELLNFGKYIELAGPYLITDGTYYSVSSIAGTFTLSPSSVEEIKIDGEPYISLLFLKGSVFLPTTKVLQKVPPMFSIFQDFVIRGKLPKFITPDVLENCLIGAGKYVSGKFKAGDKTTEVLLSVIYRDAKDPKKYIRQSPKGAESIVKGLIDMKYGYTTLAAKTTHNYFLNGVKSAMVAGELPVSPQDVNLGNLK